MALDDQKTGSNCHQRQSVAKETGFYYLQSRYYDPALGRFLNADSYASTGQGFLGYNMFAYCGNNPVLYGDWGGTRIYNGPWEDRTDSGTGSVTKAKELYETPTVPTTVYYGTENGYNYTCTAYSYTRYNSSSDYPSTKISTDKTYYKTDITDYIHIENERTITAFETNIPCREGFRFVVDYGQIVMCYDVDIKGRTEGKPGRFVVAMVQELEGILNSVDTVGGLGDYACGGYGCGILHPVPR